MSNDNTKPAPSPAPAPSPYGPTNDGQSYEKAQVPPVKRS